MQAGKYIKIFLKFDNCQCGKYVCLARGRLKFIFLPLAPTSRTNKGQIVRVCADGQRLFSCFSAPPYADAQELSCAGVLPEIQHTFRAAGQLSVATIQKWFGDLNIAYGSVMMRCAWPQKARRWRKWWAADALDSVRTTTHTMWCLWKNDRFEPMRTEEPYLSRPLSKFSTIANVRSAHKTRSNLRIDVLLDNATINIQDSPENQSLWLITIICEYIKHLTGLDDTPLRIMPAAAAS